MGTKHHEVEATAETNSALTDELIVAEATADPSLSKDKITLGGREFTVVSLGYREYLQFVARLRPILDLVAGKVKNGITDAAGGGKAISIQGIAMSTLSNLEPNFLMDFCAEDLPAMTAIVCNMAALREDRPEDTISKTWIEDNATSPFQLIDIILRQVQKNNMIVEFATFFAQALPIFLGTKKTTNQAQ